MHSTIKTHILLTGATGVHLHCLVMVSELISDTGYIGGSVLTKLLSHPLSETFRITVVVRAAEKATQFRKMGIQAVVGSYADLDLLTELASKADLVVACVSRLRIVSRVPSRCSRTLSGQCRQFRRCQSYPIRLEATV